MSVRFCSLRVVIIFFLLLGSSAESIAQTADQLGRLFNTPRDRHELDEIRNVWLQGNEQEDITADVETDLDVMPRPPASLYLKLEGTVRQADGSHTVWINGDSVPQRLLPDNIRLARVGDLIVLWVSYLNKLFVVRPGQVLHFASEAVYEMYQLPPELAVYFAPAPSQAADAVQPDATNTSGVASASADQDLETSTAEAAGLFENIANITETLQQIQELTP